MSAPTRRPFLLFFFDDTSLAFLKRVKSLTFQILAQTFQVQTVRSRFEFRGYLIPLDFVVFEGTQQLGFFDPHGYRLGINKRLMLTMNEGVLSDVIKHELAHLFTRLLYGSEVAAHGEEFKAVCRQYNIPKEVSLATLNLADHLEHEERSPQSERLLAKVKKLLSLASSQNEHESELATLKANQILRDYNLSRLELAERDEPTYLKRVLSAKKRNSKLQAIYDILQTFHVQPVFNQSRGQCALEVCGDKTNVELADYIASFLDYELDRGWREAQLKNPALKGALAKNSYFRGLAKGYLARQRKIAAQSESSGPVSSQALTKLAQDLKHHVRRALPKLSSVATSQVGDHARSHQVGLEAGSNLSIRPGLKSSSEASVRLLK